MMSGLKKDYDILICGSGISGALLARSLSDAGYSVLCVEKGKKGYVRTCWTNDVPLDALQSSLLKGIDIPYEYMPEIMAVCNQEGETAFYFDPHKYVRSLNMEQFVIRLRDKALESGADIWYDSELVSIKREDDGVVSEIKNLKSKRRIITRYVIDCSGFNSLIRREYFGDEILDADFIYAFRFKYKVGAYKIDKFWARHRLASESALLKMSENGGFNTTAIYPNKEDEVVEILCGGNDRFLKKRMEEILKREFNVKARIISGGGGKIPIRRPFLSLYKDRVFSLGDSSSMIYPMCASGVATIIMASEILLDAIKRDNPFFYQRKVHSIISSKYAIMTFFRKIIEKADKEVARDLFDLVINPVSMGYVFSNKSIINIENIYYTLRKFTKVLGRPTLLGQSGIYLLAGIIDSVLYSFASSKRDTNLLNLLESRMIKLFTR